MPGTPFFLALGWLASAANGADCDTDTTSPELDDALSAAEIAFGTADPDAFLAARDRSWMLLECADPADDQLARVHRIEGLWAFGRGEEDAALKAFTHARRLAPDVEILPSTLVPDGHPLHHLFEEAAPKRTRRAIPGLVVTGAGVGLGVAGLADLIAGQRAYNRFLTATDDAEAEQIWANDVAPRQGRVPVALIGAGVVASTGVVLIGSFR